MAHSSHGDEKRGGGRAPKVRNRPLDNDKKIAFRMTDDLVLEAEERPSEKVKAVRPPARCSNSVGAHPTHLSFPLDAAPQDGPGDSHASDQHRRVVRDAAVRQVLAARPLHQDDH